MPRKATPYSSERSVKGQRWKFLPAKSDAPSVTDALLEQAHIADDKRDAFLTPKSYASFIDTDFQEIKKLRHFDDACQKIADAIRNNQRIGISSDYDCDGNCSAALMYRFLLACGVTPDNVVMHVPNRSAEGYGVNEKAVDAMAKREVDLLLTLDNGTHAYAPIEKALSSGMGVIVIDHHPDSEHDDPDTQEHSIPAAALVINPTYSKTKKQARADNISAEYCAAMHDMAAVGVTTMVAYGVAEKLGADLHATEPYAADEKSFFAQRNLPPPIMRDYLGLTALATVADVVNIKKPINRFLVHEGLKVINDLRDDGTAYDPAVHNFAQLVTRNFPITEEDIAFRLGPIINAPGRLADSVAWRFLSGVENTISNSAQQGFERNFGLSKSFTAQACEAMKDHIDTLRKLIKEERPQEDFTSIREDDLTRLNTQHRLEKNINPKRLAQLDDDARQLILLSEEHNHQRKKLEAALLEKARIQAKEALQNIPEPEVLVLHGENWHEGLVGIVAGRIKEEFGKPTLVGSVHETKEGKWQFKCSGRSIDVVGYPVDIGEAFRQVHVDAGNGDANSIFNSAGGHPMAAGASFVRNSKADVLQEIEKLRTSLNSAPLLDDPHGEHKISFGALAKTAREHACVDVAGSINLNTLTLSHSDVSDPDINPALKKFNGGILPLSHSEREKLLHGFQQRHPALYQELALIKTIKEMDALAPYGQGHRRPLFMMHNVSVSIKDIKGPDDLQRHIALKLSPSVTRFSRVSQGIEKPSYNAMAFHCVGTDLGNTLQGNADAQGKPLSFLCSAKLEHLNAPDPKTGLSVRPSFLVEDLMKQTGRWKEEALPYYGAFAARQSTPNRSRVA